MGTQKVWGLGMTTSGANVRLLQERDIVRDPSGVLTCSWAT